MAQFRRSHQRQSRGAASTILRVLLLAVILLGFVLAWQAIRELFTRPERVEDRFYLPEGGRGQRIAHRTYSLSYVESWKQAEWVAYVLRGEDLRKPWLPREDDYRPDPQVRQGTADSRDFRHPDYDRGHLVAVADRAYDREAMRETFFMSNISPQHKHFNRGIWRELEENVREWAKQKEELFVLSGPVMTEPPLDEIGRNQLKVPADYFKVLLDLREPDYQGIAFVIPNQLSREPLHRYALTIDSAEALTGLDFFPDLMEDELEKELEATYERSAWPTDERRFRRRLEEWNRQD